MKKLLLFSLALGLGTMTYAQSPSRQSYKQNTQAPAAISYFDAPSFDQAGPVNNHKSTKTAISAITFGYSANVYTMLVEQSNCLTVNEDVGVINFTHRGGASTASTASGDILHSFSTDGGDTWKTDFMLANSATHANRYPSGAIYNPVGNTNVNDAYIVYAGPAHDAGVWNNTFFGSAKFDSTNISNQYIPSSGALVRKGITATTDGKIHVMGASYTEVSQSPYTYKTDTVFLMTGTFNNTSNSFDWSTYKMSTFNFVLRTNGSQAGTSYHWNSAWSDDGVVGYYWTFGRYASNDYRSFQPLVWKTVDNGTTWTMETPFDFSTLTNITDWLQNMKGMTTSRPQFSTSADGVVDANGKLHLVATVNAAFSNNDDSLGYSFTVAGTGTDGHMYNPVFDIFMTDNGWDAQYLGKVYTVAVEATNCNYGSGTDAITWDERIQASRTKDGTKVFAAWADSDTATAPINGDGFQYNLLPNIIVAGYDINSGKRTLPTNFTIGTSIDGDCFFHYLSDVVMTNAGTYTIPITEIDKGTDPTNTITHNYIKGIDFTDADFVTNPGFSSTINNIASVSQNRPNPFSGTTTIDVKLTQSSSVVVEVMNVTGQKVMELNNGTLNAGNHSFKINASQLSSGIYFYTVRAGNSSVTKKMIVQ